MAGLCEGRVAIITGAGRGIGREHALLLAHHGAKVVVNDLGGSMDGEGNDQGPAQDVVDEITRTSLFGASPGFFSKSSGFVVLANAMRRPSGDQSGAPAPRGRSVTAAASPPANGSTKICGGPPALLTKASLRPSDDQRGEESRVPDVSDRGGALPSAGTTQMLVS